MRFISPNPGYKFSAVKQQWEQLVNGQIREIAPGFMCEFIQSPTAWEQEYARKNFKFRGVPHDESGVREIDPVLTRLSVFDTDTITNPELRKKVEKRLLETQRAEDHVLVEIPVETPPWIGYDKLVAQGARTVEKVAEKIAARVTEDGFTPSDIAQVISYEERHLNREPVLAALKALLTEAPEELVVA